MLYSLFLTFIREWFFERNEQQKKEVSIATYNNNMRTGEILKTNK